MEATDWLDELRDPHDGEIVEHYDGRKLRVGAFYWAMPTNDPDIEPGRGWEWFEQPARFAGVNDAGELLWHCLNCQGDERFGATNWPMRWIGDEIVRPA